MSINRLNPLLQHSVTLIRVEFWDGINEPWEIFGTGFWVKSSEGHNTLVTNRHNLDPSLKKPDFANLKISKIMVQFRKFEEKAYTSTTEFLEMDLARLDGLLHSNADVAVLFSPSFKTNKGISGNFSYEPILFKEMADAEFHYNKTEILDPVAFIGFPQKWYDHKRSAPIARLAHIASDTSAPFSNKEIITADVSLVAGLSFGGSSGSPVFLLPKGILIQAASNIKIDSSYISGAVLGIMSGHCRDYHLAQESDRYKPMSLLDPSSGLSYYTRSTSILELLSRTCGESIQKSYLFGSTSGLRHVHSKENYS